MPRGRPRKDNTKAVLQDLKVEKEVKPNKDAKITVTVSFPGKEPMQFGYSIPNANNNVARPKQNALAFQRAIYEGLAAEYGGMVKVTL